MVLKVKQRLSPEDVMIVTGSEDRGVTQTGFDFNKWKRQETYLIWSLQKTSNDIFE